METANIINSSPLLLVDFYADWCEPCKWLNPILTEVSEILNDTARIRKVDIEQEPRLAEEYDVRSVPTLILFKEGVPVWRMAGFKVASELVEIIESHR